MMELDAETPLGASNAGSAPLIPRGALMIRSSTDPAWIPPSCG